VLSNPLLRTRSAAFSQNLFRWLGKGFNECIAPCDVVRKEDWLTAPLGAEFPESFCSGLLLSTNLCCRSKVGIFYGSPLKTSMLVGWKEWYIRIGQRTLFAFLMGTSSIYPLFEPRLVLVAIRELWADCRELGLLCCSVGL